MDPSPPLDWIAVRIEVTDTGCGIRRRDMIESKLFCMHSCSLLDNVSPLTLCLAAFNQTERGRQQGRIHALRFSRKGTDISAGGKGTGLGLALVRQIVSLTGGRLGLQSKANRGSTFWVELRK
jgi:osomolarity two-component system sensor histidine kinase SLN1